MVETRQRKQQEAAAAKAPEAEPREEATPKYDEFDWDSWFKNSLPSQ